MKRTPKIEKHVVPPPKSIVAKNFPKVDYCDSFAIRNDTNISNDEIINCAFKTPRWVKALIKLRNILVTPFGLETDSVIGKPSSHYAVGEKARFFEVTDRNETEIVMGETDKHLQFRLSIMQVDQGDHRLVYFTTIVHFKNIGGRIYFFPVKPFHVLILKSMVRSFYNSIYNENK